MLARLVMEPIGLAPIIHCNRRPVRALIDELRALAMKQGMRTLLQDALEKSLRGVTDIKHARSVAVK